jgi:hypothetical protein
VFVLVAADGAGFVVAEVVVLVPVLVPVVVLMAFVAAEEGGDLHGRSQ